MLARLHDRPCLIDEIDYDVKNEVAYLANGDRVKLLDDSNEVWSGVMGHYKRVLRCIVPFYSYEVVGFIPLYENKQKEKV